MTTISDQHSMHGVGPLFFPELAPPLCFFLGGVPLFSTNQAKQIIIFCWGPSSSLVFCAKLKMHIVEA